MIRVFYRNAEIDRYNTRIEAEIGYGDDDEVVIEEYCDICKLVKVGNGQTICKDCELGINVDFLI